MCLTRILTIVLIILLSNSFIFSQCSIIPTITSTNTNALCSGSQLDLTTTVSVPIGCQLASGTPYRWIRDLVPISNTAVNFLQISSASSGNYSVQIEIIDDGSGTCPCTGGGSVYTNAAIPVIVYETPPQPVLTQTPNPVYNNCNVTIGAASTNVSSGSTFKWYNSNAASAPIIHIGDSLHTSVSSNTTFYVEDVQNSCPSIKTPITISPTIMPLPTTSYTSNTVSLCEGENISLIAAPSLSGAILYWYNDISEDSLVQIGTSYTTPNLFSNKNYWVRQAINGCKSAPLQVTVNIFSIASPNYNVIDTACIGEQAILDASSNSSSTSPVFEWYNDATLTSLAYVGVPFPTPPIQNSSITYWLIEKSGNCASSPVQINLPIRQLDPPILPVNNSICQGSTISLSPNYGNSNQQGDFYWYHSPNNSAMHIGPSFAFTVNSSDTIYIQERDGLCESPIIPVPVTSIPLPVVSITSSTPNHCEGDSLILEATSSSLSNYLWTTPSGITSVESSKEIPNITSNQHSGLYLVQAIDIATNCLSIPDSIFITINNIPQTPNISTNAPICAGDTLILNADIINSATYYWTNNNGLNVSTNNHTFDTTGLPSDIYMVEVEVNGCRSNQGSISITINEIPAPPIIGSDTMTCEGDYLELNITNSNIGASYYWIGPNNFNSTNQNNTITNISVSNGGTYIVTVTKGGCTNIASQNISIGHTPSVPYFSFDTIICEGDELTLFAEDESDLEYIWQGPNAYLSKDRISKRIVNDPTFIRGTYSLTVKDTISRCLSDQVNFYVDAQATPSIQYSNDTAITEGNDNINLYATGGVEYIWSSSSIIFKNPYIPFVSTENIPNLSSGLHSINLEVKNSSGCSSSSSINIDIQPKTELFIPNVITPNGDNQNDIWNIKYLENLQQDYIIQVFDAFGNTVYYHSDNNYSSTPWDGTNERNQPLPEGTYVYVIQIADSPQNSYRGAVSIIRRQN